MSDPERNYDPPGIPDGCLICIANWLRQKVPNR